MEKQEQRISPAGFALLNESLLNAESRGESADAAAFMACRSVGIFPNPRTEIAFIVDYSLDGPIWPFMAWPKGWDRHDKTTWR